MVEINGKHFCENCFEETISSVCAHCGYDPSAAVNDPTMLTPGSILLGKYIVGKVIGKGGFGVTYLAYDASAGRKAAIKEFFPYGVALRAAGTSTVTVSSMDNANAFKLGAEKFYDEAKLVSRFNGNPNIVGVYEFFYENDTVYFAMEYLQGHTLKEHINTNGTISAPQALFIAQNVANALMAAHSSSVLHRDISPDNIILCDNGDVKLIDFGAARQVVAEHSQSFSVILKPGFAPLEQYQKKGKQGPWTDIYSLGATLYFALTGDIPEDPMTRLDDDTEFSSNRFGINSEMWDIIYKAAMLRTEDRYSDIFEMKNALGKVSFQPEPITVPNINAEQKPEFRTALPYGMTRNVAVTQAVTQAVGQNVGVTAVYGNTVQQSNASALPQTKEFFRRHLRAIITVSCVLILIAAFVLPSVLKKDDITDYYSNDGEAVPVGNSTSGIYGDDTPDLPVGTEKPPVATTDAAESEPYKPSVDIPSDKAYYNALTDKAKPIYEAIYSGLENWQTEIKLPKHDISDKSVDIIYYEVLYDNPQFCYAGACTVDKTVVPSYLVEKGAVETLETFAELSYLSEIDKSDKVTALREIHDRLIQNVAIAERYSNQTSTLAYGAIVNSSADDVGMAKAFCYLAQRLGLPCYVVDGTWGGVLRAWCRVQLDGTWYNVDVYGDWFGQSAVIKTPMSDYGGEYYHTYFLTNDTYIKYCGYVPNTEYDFIWEGSYAAASPLANYYIQHNDEDEDRYYTFYYENVDEAYAAILEWAAERYNSGDNISSNCIASFMIDEVWLKAKTNFLSDLSEKYGIDVSEATAEYGRNYGEFTITLKP